MNTMAHRIWKNGSVKRLSDAGSNRDVVTFRVSQRPVRIVAQLGQGEVYSLYKQTGEIDRRVAGKTQRAKDLVPVTIDGAFVQLTGSYMEKIVHDPGEYALVFSWSNTVAPGRERMSRLSTQELAVQPCGH
jgi:hypothetical protein